VQTRTWRLGLGIALSLWRPQDTARFPAGQTGAAPAWDAARTASEPQWTTPGRAPYNRPMALPSPPSVPIHMAPRKAQRPARVAMVVAHPARHNGRAALMARTLAEAGHAVTLYTVEGEPRPGLLPDAVRTVDCLGPGGNGSAPPEAFAGVDLAGTDVLQVAGRAALGALAGRVTEGMRLVYDVPGADFGAPDPREVPAAGPRGWLKGLKGRVGEWLGAARVDAVLCPGYAFGEFLQRELKLGRVPVVPIYAAHPFRESVRPMAPPCLTPGRPAAALLGGEHAAMVPAVAALALLKGVDLVAVNGTGDFAPLAAAAEAHGVGRRVHRLEVDPADLIPTLAAFQVGLVLPADTSQHALYDLPDALFGFFMAGVPVVTSNLPGIEHVVWTHNVGTLVELDDPEQVADAVGRTCTDPALRERLLHNVGLVRRKRYAWEAQEGRLLDLYDLVLGGEPGGAPGGAPGAAPG